MFIKYVMPGPLHKLLINEKEHTGYMYYEGFLVRVPQYPSVLIGTYCLQTESPCLWMSILEEEKIENEFIFSEGMLLQQ